MHDRIFRGLYRGEFEAHFAVRAERNGILSRVERCGFCR